MSDVARDLAWVGIDIEKSGGIKIVGPLGLERPFASLDLGGRRERLNIWLEEGMIKELKSISGGNVREALRETLRPGALAVSGRENVRIVGPFGRERPLLTVTYSELRDKRAKEAFKRLKGLK
ncbi:MAG: hypothetical protein ACTSWV_03450 [Candidatus Asgardarchaeia archaeon]